MSGVELKVVLVSDDAEQQKAFNRTLDDARRAEEARFQPTPPQPPPFPPPVASQGAPATPSAPSGQQQKTESKETEQKDTSILRRLEDALDRVFGKRADGAKKVIARARGLARRARPAVRKALKAFRKTKLGRSVMPKLEAAGKRFAETRAGKAFTGAFGRGAGAAATEAGAAAASAGAAAEGGGAAAAAGAAPAAAAGPLIALGIVVVGAALTVKAFNDALKSATNEIEDLSPAVATVKAQFSAQMELARLDRAERIGEGSARLEAARNRIAESSYEVQTKILELILRFAPLLEAVADTASAGIRGIDLIVATINVVVSRMDDWKGQLANNKVADDQLQKSRKEFLEALRDVFEENDQWAGADPMLVQLLRMPGPGGAQRGPRGPIRGNFP